jgi:hypothetical protein
MKLVDELGSDDLFNPYRDVCEYDVSPNAPLERRKRLRAHLRCDHPGLILCGEAAGFRGARYAGVAFTSERILMSESIPRVPIVHQRITSFRLSMCEPSASIVWGALRSNGIADRTILWNALPAHPLKSGDPFTNRTPTSDERKAGLEILKQLLRLYPRALVLAVGRTAEASLRDIGVDPAAALRHPANGGANAFREGLRRLLISHKLHAPLQQPLAMDVAS